MAVLAGGKVPKALENRPLLLSGLDLYFEAYNELSYDRPAGFDGVAGPIPWSSIIKWCELRGISDINDIGTCIRYIRAMEQKEYEINGNKEPKP